MSALRRMSMRRSSGIAKRPSKATPVRNSISAECTRTAVALIRTNAKRSLGIAKRRSKGTHPRNAISAGCTRQAGVLREAISWYRKAAEQGLALGQYNLGVMYMSGQGVERDEPEVARLFKLAADRGEALAEAALGWQRLKEEREDREAAAARENQKRQQQREEQERQREAAERERKRQQQQEKERQKEAAEEERRKRQEKQDRWRDAAPVKMSAAQAFEVLGIKMGATEQEIRAAYNRLMKRVHPDVGGSDFLAKQLNAARDVLLR
jgi:flagellar biosynthesis GTPase FlhF